MPHPTPWRPWASCISTCRRPPSGCCTPLTTPGRDDTPRPPRAPRGDVKAHDAQPFTSADVKFSILEVLKKVHPRGINTFREVSDVETPDATTAIFKLTRPAPYLMMALSGYESPMLPKHIYEKG